MLAPTAAAKQQLVGRSFVEIYGNRYDQTSVGPISPSIVAAYVQNPADPNGPPALFFLDYIANTPIAVQFGIEAWGFMKRLGDTQSDFSGGNKGFRVAYRGAPILTMKIQNADARFSPESPDVHSVAIGITPRSNWGAGQTFNRDETLGRYRFAAFDPAQDTFKPEGFLKRNLDAIDFGQPMLWGFANFEGIYHTDLAQIRTHKNDPVTDGSPSTRREF
jgi:hypothetical protein